MPKPLLLGLAAFAVTAAGIAVAQDMPPPRGAMMRADANGDGVITRQEALDQAGQRFDRLDADRDGKLDQSEVQRIGRAMRRMGGDMPPPPVPPKP